MAAKYALFLLLMLSTASAESMNGFRLDDATYLKGRDRVLGVSINGAARAYPIRILNYHEIVNDVIGGTAAVITYCPLCGSGTAFNGSIGIPIPARLSA